MKCPSCDNKDLITITREFADHDGEYYIYQCVCGKCDTGWQERTFPFLNLPHFRKIEAFKLAELLKVEPSRRDYFVFALGQYHDLLDQAHDNIVSSLMQVIEGLRDSLKYYSHPDSYEGRETLSGWRQPGVLTEGGNKARQSLAEAELKIKDLRKRHE